MERNLFLLIKTTFTNIPLSIETRVEILQNLPKLFNISKKHDLAHLLCYALEKNGLLDNDLEAKKKFLRERNSAIWRFEQQEYEINAIQQVFEKNRILFIPLKGAILKEFYFEPWLRTSCDIDLLVRKEDFNRAIKCLEKGLNYVYTVEGDHDCSILTPSKVNIELHYSLLVGNSKQTENAVLEQVWENVDGDTCCKKMKDEYFYCYHVSHIAKHLKFGGCGVRWILDTWVLNNKIEFNKEKRYALLEKAGLLSVAKAIEKLAEVWFSNEEDDELSKVLGEYVFTGGLYGTFENKVVAQQARKKNRVSYLWSRLFPSFVQMKYKYPKLRKHPILYPFYVVKRWFLLFKKDKRSLAKIEINQMSKNNRENQAKVAKLFKDLDI